MRVAFRRQVLRMPRWLACALIVAVSVSLSVAAALVMGQAAHQDPSYYRSALKISAVVPVLVASPVSWFVVSLLHEVESAHTTALNLAWRDELTGLLHRRRFVELAERELDAARRSAVPLAAALIDLDHFKDINDEFGHAVGDAVLRAAAQACSQALRNTDLIARWGGEEFVVVLPVAEPGAAAEVVERVRAAIAAQVLTGPGGVPVRCTASIGLAQFDPRSLAFDDLIRGADLAMYQAKATGRNRVVVSGPLT
jgi:diguanylate cyclase (GGDEF)-like protein